MLFLIICRTRVNEGDLEVDITKAIKCQVFDYSTLFNFKYYNQESYHIFIGIGALCNLDM
jgi:hypothetical protein